MAPSIPIPTNLAAMPSILAAKAAYSNLMNRWDRPGGPI